MYWPKASALEEYRVYFFIKRLEPYQYKFTKISSKLMLYNIYIVTLPRTAAAGHSPPRPGLVCGGHFLYCILYTVNCTLYTVNCTLYTVYGILYTVNCTL